MALLTVEQGTDMVVCLPCYRGALQWHGLTLDAWRTWNPLGTPLVNTGDIEAALASAVAYCFSQMGRACSCSSTLRRTDRLPPPSRPPPMAVVRPGHLRRRNQFDQLCADGKTARTLSPPCRASKRKLAWARRALERVLGGALTMVDEGGCTEAVERLLSMEAAGWKGRIGSAVACNSGHLNLFREACAGLRRRVAYKSYHYKQAARP